MPDTATLSAPCYAQFVSDDSPVLVATIRGTIARVCNETGDWWDEPVANLYPAPEGWTW